MITTSEKEIAILREGGRRLARHVKELSEMVAPGIPVKALEARALEMVARDGDIPAFLHHKERGDTKGYPSSLCVSVNDVIVHSPASESNYTIKDGDIVCLDFGIKHEGLYTDHATTVIAGKGAKEDYHLIAATQEALNAGIAEARLGNTTGHIGYAVEQIAKRCGYGYPKNLSGHGVGKAVNEKPNVPNFGKQGEGEKLVEGMVIAIEPMFCRGSGELYVDADGYSYRTKDGSRTAHCEHTVIITKEGPEVLTRL